MGDIHYTPRVTLSLHLCRSGFRSGILSVDVLVKMNRQILVLAVLVGVAVASQCFAKRDTSNFITAAEGWEHCDSNGLACCYYVNGSVIIFSHGFNNGSYNPNTHCEYVIDLDPECNIAICAGMDFGMHGNDMISIHTSDMELNWRSKKRPFNSIVEGNKATVRFQSGPELPPDGTKWSLGIVCVPKIEHKSVCEVCDEIADQQEEGPNGDSILKSLE